jgi:integrase/recombinase XerC
MRRWDGLLERYMEGYGARDLSAGRVEGVRRELEKWGLWLKRRRPQPKLEEVSAEQVQMYIQSRTTFRSKGTLYSVMGILRGMGDFLTEEGYWPQNPLRWMRGPKMDPRRILPRRISAASMEQLWTTVVERRSGYRQILWVCLLSVLYGTGLRRGELIRLKVSDWDCQQQTLTVDGRKSGMQRRVVVPEVSALCLEQYRIARHNRLMELGRPDETALFVSERGGRLSNSSISGGLSRLVHRSGLDRITLHQFRHTCASDLLEAGLHVAQVQAILGHQSIGTTVRYLQVSDPQRAEAVRRHPINSILLTKGVSA